MKGLNMGHQDHIGLDFSYWKVLSDDISKKMSISLAFVVGTM